MNNIDINLYGYYSNFVNLHIFNLTNVSDFEVWMSVLASVCAKIYIYFNLRTYFFYFTQPLFKNIHVRLSILHL